MNREAYSQKQQILMRRLIARHAKPVFDAIMGQMREAAATVRQYGVSQARGRISPLNDDIGTAVTNIYIEAAQGAKKNYFLTKKFGGNTDFINKVLAYLKRFLLNKVIIPISRTTKDQIERTLNKAITEGWGTEKTAKYLEDTDIPKVRARLIVRTESVRATNYTQLIAAEDENYQVEKQWIAIEDKRTRVSHSHNGVDGQVQNLNEPFTNGLVYPGDPDAPIEETANCRCTMGYRLKRDLSGNPIPKVVNTN